MYKTDSRKNLEMSRRNVPFNSNRLLLALLKTIFNIFNSLASKGGTREENLKGIENRRQDEVQV